MRLALSDPAGDEAVDQRFVVGVERQDRDHRAEDLLLRDHGIGGDVGENRGLDEPATIQALRPATAQHETAFLLAKGRPEAPNPAGSDVIEWMREKDAAHPNQKPVSALYPLIESFAPRGGVVFDPFMGSGSTLRAAKDTGRCGVGIEIEERWCRFAVERLRQEVLFAI